MKTWMAAAVLAAWTAAAEGWTVHVAPHGDDNGAGTAESPLASPAGARDLIRRKRAANGGALPQGGAVAVFADGEYVLSEPLKLDRRDAGVEFRAANRGKAVFSGAMRGAAAWRCATPEEAARLGCAAAREKVRVLDLPAAVALPGFCGGGNGVKKELQELPVSLFQGGRRLTPARWPNEGFAKTGANADGNNVSGGGKFAFAAEQMRRWEAEADMWAFGLWHHEWADAVAKVLRVDAAAGRMEVDPRPIGYGIRKGAEFYVFNALCELDREGEWAIDRAARKLYAWPAQGAGEMVAAFASALVEAQECNALTLDGLAFAYCRGTAVAVKNSRRATVRGCVVKHTSEWGIAVEGGVSNRVAGCDMYDLGEGGIRMTGGDLLTLEPGGHVAENNHIHHYGQVIYNYRPGIKLSGTGNRALHNLIHHSKHNAVVFEGNDHYVGYNVIHDTCAYNNDAGAVYCCQRDWSKRGTVVEYNLIHMTGSAERPLAHNEGIYLDDYSSGVTVRGNIINFATMGLYLGGGQGCVVERNLFVSCGSAMDIASRGNDSWWSINSRLGRKSGMFKKLEAHLDVYSNALWRARYPDLLKVYDFEDASFAHGALFNAVSNNAGVASGNIVRENWKDIGPFTAMGGNRFDLDDPRFEDYRNFGWMLKDGAVRDVVGDLPFGKMGLYASAERASPPRKFGEGVSLPRPLGRVLSPAGVRIDFQLCGKLPEGVERIAECSEGCELPAWGGGARMVARFGDAAAQWRSYAIAFVPALDCEVSMEIMGARGKKTLYDDFAAEGTELRNGGFEAAGAWGQPKPSDDDPRSALCDISLPYGVAAAETFGSAAAEGRNVACGNDMINFTQRLRFKRGVPVRLTFKAKAAE